jgi:DNA polymerase III subunit gamma/tau
MIVLAVGNLVILLIFPTTLLMAQGYQVIARRWRPQQFDEIVGQDHITRTLKNAITSGRIAHAYLFVGPRGTGKTTTARMFAKALNCEGGPSITPDDTSDICKSIMDGSCMDVIEIDGASNNSVEQIRQLREDCQYAPAQCPFKIYIIDEVHMLSTGAFNALLKTLEEPPSHVKFLFATTEAHKILPTIVSRCQRFEFRPISDEQICSKLQTIADAEKISIDEPALKSVARLANGGMRDAQSTLDQLISFCGDSITEADVLEVYGLASQDQIHQLATLLVQANYPAILSTVEELAKGGKDLYRILVDLQSYLREVLVEGIHSGGVTKRLGPPIRVESLMRMNDALHRGEAGVKMGLSQTVNFEVTLLRAVEESRTRAIDGLIKELTALAQAAPEASGQKKK